MKTIELFAGTGSFSKVAKELGHETFMTDYEEIDGQDLVADVRDLKESDFPYRPDVLWASPPCEGFSVMNIGRNWNHDHTPKTQKAELAQELVQHTLRLIEKLEPVWWFIENPVDKLRRLSMMCENETICTNPAVVAQRNARRVGSLFEDEFTTTPTQERTVLSVSNGQKVYRKTVHYCQYGERRQKPTDVWTNAYWWTSRPTCKRGAPCHDAAPRGSQSGTQGMGTYKDKSRIPPELFREIFEQMP